MQSFFFCGGGGGGGGWGANKVYYGRCANGECWFSSEIINKMAILKGQAFCNSWSRDQLFVNTTTIHFGKVIFVGTKKSISIIR